MNSDLSACASESSPPAVWRLALGYSLTILVTVGLFFLIRSYGDQLNPAAAHLSPRATGSGGATENAILFHVLLALLAIILLGRWLSKLFEKIGQPRVLGEMVAGILLGPSLLGRISPEAMNFVLPRDVGPFLGIIALLGVILYMFLVGLELNAGLLRSRAHATVAISHTSILVPFLLGAALALWLYPRLATEGVPFTSFALFMGVAMSITAFPVLARILTDRRMDKTELGILAIGCAAIDDVTAWCLLALVVGVAQSEVGEALGTTLWAAAYIALMLTFVRWLANRYLGAEAEGKHPQRRMAVWVLVALLISALVAESIGIHAIFGAFLLGAVIPHDCAVARDFRSKLEDIVKILLLPAFFAYTGMRTEIGLVAGPAEWLYCAAIILVATLGKFGGTLVAARVTGLGWRTSAALGILMNTRGLMELVVLNIGLELGVISPKLFAMMVVMAVVTTFATTPILHFLSTYQPSAVTG